MRKINVEVRCVVMVPITFKTELLIRADDDADISKAVRLWAKNKPYSKADVEDASLSEVLRIGDQRVEDVERIWSVDAAVEALLENRDGGIEVKGIVVTDSR